MASSRKHVLELLNAVHALRLLLRVHEAAERSLELLSARAMRHTTQARAVPVDLAGLGVESGFLASLLLELFRVHASLAGCSSLFADLRGDGVEGLGRGVGVVFLELGEDGDWCECDC